MRSVLAKPRRAGNLFIIDSANARTAVVGLIFALLLIATLRYFLTGRATDRGVEYEHRYIEELTE